MACRLVRMVPDVGLRCVDVQRAVRFALGHMTAKCFGQNEPSRTARTAPCCYRNEATGACD